MERNENTKENIKEVKISVLKEKYHTARAISYIGHLIDNKSNIPIDDAIKNTLEEAHELSKETKIHIINKVVDLFKSIEIIDKLLLNFKNRPNELLWKVYGANAKWEVKAERKSWALVFYISDSKDYCKLAHDPNNRSSWVKVNRSRIHALEWKIVFINNDTDSSKQEIEDITNHEVRHVLNWVIWVNEQTWHLSRAKDEIIAYLRDYSDTEDIESKLLDRMGLYYYHKWEFDENIKWERHKTIIKKSLQYCEAIISLYWWSDWLNLMSITGLNHWDELITYYPEIKNIVIWDWFIMH